MVSTETLVIVHRDSRVLLAMKKRGFGVGKWNGFGGKLKDEDNGSLYDAARRETVEEGKIYINGHKMIGKTLYKFEGDEQDHLVHVFVTDYFEGEPRETEEMKPKWFDENEIPEDDMWHNDRYWIPYLLRGEKFEAVIKMTAEGDTTSCVINDKEYIK